MCPVDCYQRSIAYEANNHIHGGSWKRLADWHLRVNDGFGEAKRSTFAQTRRGCDGNGFNDLIELEFGETLLKGEWHSIASSIGYRKR